MNELTETLRSGLAGWGEFMEITLNALSLLCIVAGVIVSFVASVQERRRAPGVHLLHTYFRRAFGGWLVVALEFQLAADIVATIIAPTNRQLIELGVIAVIRTFLNYFLNKELSEQTDLSVIGGDKKIKR